MDSEQPKQSTLQGDQDIVKSTIEEQLIKTKRDLQSMVLKYAKSESENLDNLRKADEAEKKLQRAIKDNEQLASRIRILTNDKNQLSNNLSAKVAELTVLHQKRSQSDHIQVDKLKETEHQLREAETRNEELIKTIEALKSKEGETLDFCEILSMKIVLLETELDEIQKRDPRYKDDYEKSKEEIIKLNDQLKTAVQEVDSLKVALIEESEKFTDISLQMNEMEKRYKMKIDELENEIKVIKRKHQIASKELAKEVKLYKESIKFKQQVQE